MGRCYRDLYVACTFFVSPIDVCSRSERCPNRRLFRVDDKAFLRQSRLYWVSWRRGSHLIPEDANSISGSEVGSGNVRTLPMYLLISRLWRLLCLGSSSVRSCVPCFEIVVRLRFARYRPVELSRYGRRPQRHSSGLAQRRASRETGSNVSIHTRRCRRQPQRSPGKKGCAARPSVFL